MTKALMLIVVGSSFLISTSLFAHPGNTDKYGCHTNKRIGYYHCHKPKVDKNKPIYDLEKVIPKPQKFDKSSLFLKTDKTTKQHKEAK